MPNTPSNPSRRAWRPQPAARPAPTSDARRWHREPGAPGGTARRWSRRFGFGLLALAFLACTGLFVWAVLWLWPPPPARLVLVGAGYETNLTVPPNVYGREGLHALAAWSADRPASFYWGSGLLQLKAPPTELLTDAAWDAGLDGANERTVMLVFALHGGADATGPYLLRGDAAPSVGEKGRLRIADILERLKRLPARTNKLVVLDATGMGADWSLGMLHNDFARGLDGMEAEIAAVPNLAVVSASGPDQISWPVESMRRTAFGHFLMQGLRGGADENGDGRINAWELYHFTADHVERWTRSNRDAIQTPVLLPHGAEGERRTRAMHLTLVADRGAVADPPADVPAVTDREDLQRAWDHARELSRRSPPPARYAPHAWARYRAVLLRYEQLLRAADAEHAAAVAEMLPELEQQIRQAGLPPLASAENTLAMTALVAPASPDQAPAWFNTLWSAKPEELRAKWDELRASPDNPSDPAARLRLSARVMELAMDEAARNPAEIALAARLESLLRDPLRPEAAEAHFLTMLAANLPQPALPDAVLSEVLRLRRLAEEAALAVRPGDAPYSEQVFPWGRVAVEDADRSRQLGQDLLFAGDAGRLDEAAAYFRDARKGYERAAEDGAVVTAALDARDQAFADGPAYARWAALRPSSDDPAARQADEALMTQIEKLADDAHRVAALLNDRPADAALAELGQRGTAVREELKTLEARFLERADDAAREDGVRARQEAEAALAVPFPDAALRLRLIENNRAIEDRLARRGDSDKTFTASPDRQRREVIDAAQRQGRAALAVLGRSVFDERTAEPNTENYELVQHRLEVFAAEQSWWESVNVAGDQIGRRWRRLAGDANTRLDEGRAEDLTRARSALHTADALGRLLDGAEEPGWDAEPANRLLRLSMHDLLLWQAHRTVEDHWFGEKGEPYYQQSARAYVEDAGRLVGPAQLAAGVRPAEDEINRPGRLSVTPPARLALTSEPELPAEWILAPASGAYVPPALPSFRLEAGPDIQALFPGGAAAWIADLRTARTAGPISAVIRRADALADGDGPQAAPTLTEAAVVLRGFFRGQALEARAPVSVEPIPERVYRELPPPRTRALSIRADRRLQEEFGAGAGAVAVVLDCSGSMGVDPTNPQAPTKFDQATRALETVLRRLPRGTSVSVWAFGQAVGDRKTVNDPENHVAHVQPPVAWDPDDADLVRGLMARVRALQPWNETPLVRAMLEAKEDLAAAPGFRTLLVVTDGMDNRFDKEAQFTGKTIPRVVKDAFQDSGILVNVVGFRFASGEQDKAYEQFKGIETLPLPGRFVDVEDADKLAAELEESLRQRIHYWVERDDGEGLPEVPEAGLDVSLSGGGDRWFSLPDRLPSSEFKLRVRTNRTWRQSVSVNSGELLPLALGPTAGGRHELRRVFVTAYDYADRPSAHTDAWRMAVLQNQRLTDRRLQMLLMLEKAPAQTDVVLRQLRPREVWVEIDPPGAGAAPFGVRWGPQSGYGAPAYSLDVTAWPNRDGGDAPARPVLRTWWSPDEVEPDAHVERDRGLPSLVGLRNVSRTADGVTVVVESVEVERRRVEVQPGRFEPRDCLVVRLSGPPDRPFKVEPVGLNLVGQEQHFYAAAGKTTALFWPVTAAEAHDALNRLNLISLERFKKEAREKGYYLEINNLQEPTRGDARPLPPGIE